MGHFPPHISNAPQLPYTVPPNIPLFPKLDWRAKTVSAGCRYWLEPAVLRGPPQLGVNIRWV
jgi:hypothetical protein